MTAKCEVCAIPYGETVCVTCGNGPQVETAMVSALYEVDGKTRIPGFTMLTGIREGVEVEPAPCGKCGRMTISRIESPDGQVGCLECLGHFLVGGDPLLGVE